MSEKQEFRYMIRIANTDLPGNKGILYALRKIKGVGYSYANAICNTTGININKKAGELSDAEISELRNVIEENQHNFPTWMKNRRNDIETGEDMHIIGHDLKFTKETDLRRLMKIKTNRGLRHSWNLPVRGQRTRSNFRRSKGKAVGVKRKGKK